jgi:hypothetical protein
MSLDNLLKIGQLKSHPPNKDEIQRLLGAAQGNLVDAQVETISVETRFDAAYKAVMQAALASLMANGFRTDTKKPGHHMTVIQSLTLTIGLPSARVMVLDTLRRQRNIADYTGDDVDESTLGHCITEARCLLFDVQAWIKRHHPELDSST